MAFDKESIRAMVYTRLTTLAQSQDEEVALKAVKELGTIAGIYAEVAPNRNAGNQTNNFVIPPEKLGELIEGLRSVAGKSIAGVATVVEVTEEEHE